MDLSGSISENLKAAITSSQRLRNHPVHSDTLKYWQDLLAYARERRRHPLRLDGENNDVLIGQLEEELAARAGR